jgi:hypothetical protein
MQSLVLDLQLVGQTGMEGSGKGQHKEWNQIRVGPERRMGGEAIG